MKPMFTRPETENRPAEQAVAVSEFVRQARALLERSFPLGWVAGEVASLTRAASGHCYFTLRDSAAQVRCVMYRSRAQLLPFQLREGQQVEVRALTTLYEARGEFQLQVENIRQAGQGNLFEAFLRLKERLNAEGLFDEARKRPLPPLPGRIGIVTSTAGAALHDVLVALQRRAPHLPLVIYPSPVQGADAGRRLTEAVSTAGRRAKLDGVDLLLLCRGGGSLEDLWAFNDEALVRAIAACPIPVIAGIGHETDFTLSDFVADLRAATPTAAAELASAGTLRASQTLAQLSESLRDAMQHRLDSAFERLDRSNLRLRHPRERLARQQVQIADLAARMKRASATRLERLQMRQEMLSRQLGSALPSITHLRLRLDQSALRLGAAQRHRLQALHQGLDALAAQLGSLNPESVLARGFAIVRDGDGRILRTASGLGPGDPISVQMHDASLLARIETLQAKGSNADPLQG
ncbi:exodeoxyribonuclease VII large subunit [Niveibacterium sp. 24ML]|uniref:exodeoxyribonuclease VII large subunit n=1 Tax=Niveibacterium sp. 24ML TaxID=2985512 RepID=UPI00226DE9BC|nr:exodeoxyribonuclease VII large subunit [Niveibacterium sp. 24ML]MCX9157143.1 exodeoxyribonuclease VII large subunit [Niveibacterium sp. 24ML]